MIKACEDIQFASFIAQAQVDMALETENYQLDYNTVFSGVCAVINDPAKGKYYLKFVDGKPVAVLLTVTEWSDWRNKTVLWIHSVYVMPDFRKQSHYKEMYLYLKTMVQESSEYAGIRLYVDKSNTEALKVYHKLGMQSDHYALCEWLNE